MGGKTTSSQKTEGKHVLPPQSWVCKTGVIDTHWEGLVTEKVHSLKLLHKLQAVGLVPSLQADVGMGVE